MKTPTTPFALAIASLALLLSSCSKPEQPAPPLQEAPNTQVDQPNTPDQAETTRATKAPGPTRSDQAATRTAAEELSPPEKSKPPKHKHERLTRRELTLLARDKAISEIIDNLGQPVAKRQVYKSLGFENTWYYQWDISIKEDRDSSEYFGRNYPSIGMLFESSSETPVQFYLHEFLPEVNGTLPK